MDTPEISCFDKDGDSGSSRYSSTEGSPQKNANNSKESSAKNSNIIDNEAIDDGNGSSRRTDGSRRDDKTGSQRENARSKCDNSNDNIRFTGRDILKDGESELAEHGIVFDEKVHNCKTGASTNVSAISDISRGAENRSDDEKDKNDSAGARATGRFAYQLKKRPASALERYGNSQRAESKEYHVELRRRRPQSAAVRRRATCPDDSYPVANDIDGTRPHRVRLSVRELAELTRRLTAPKPVKEPEPVRDVIGDLRLPRAAILRNIDRLYSHYSNEHRQRVIQDVIRTQGNAARIGVPNAIAGERRAHSANTTRHSMGESSHQHSYHPHNISDDLYNYSSAGPARRYREEEIEDVVRRLYTDGVRHKTKVHESLRRQYLFQPRPLGECLEQVRLKTGMQATKDDRGGERPPRPRPVISDKEAAEKFYTQRVQREKERWDRLCNQYLK